MNVNRRRKRYAFAARQTQSDDRIRVPVRLKPASGTGLFTDPQRFARRDATGWVLFDRPSRVDRYEVALPSVVGRKFVQEVAAFPSETGVTLRYAPLCLVVVRPVLLPRELPLIAVPVVPVRRRG